jgi:NAD-dependent deacetylase
VWFGEPIDPEVLKKAFAALDCDVFFTIGTSSLVNPAAALVHEAKARGAYTVEMNLEPTAASRSLDCALQGPAEDLLDKLERLLICDVP